MQSSALRADHSHSVTKGSTMDKPIIMGIDVSKEWLDAALAGEGRVERLEN